MEQIARTDTAAGADAQALARFMVRTESIASSRIEHESASSEDFARAVAGHKSNASAISLVAATEAIQGLLLATARTGRIAMDAVLDAHRALMHRDSNTGDAAWAGRVREEPNWIGGSDASPRGALYIPPAPGRVAALLQDLETYLNRDDVPMLTQAAIGHAQFESIHPFTDGNGRIGRAIIGAVLQRRGATQNVITPVASGLHAVREPYFDALNEYRAGESEPIISVIADTSHVAASEAGESVRRLRELPAEWTDLPELRGRPTVPDLARQLAQHPTIIGEDMARFTGATSSGYAAIDLFEHVGVLREITGRKRDRLWVVTDVLGELDDLDRRIHHRLNA